MPATQGIFIRVWLLFDAIIDNQHGVGPLNLSHQRLDDLPQVGGGELWLRKRVILSWLMASLSRFAIPVAGRQPERRDQIVGVEIKQCFIHFKRAPFYGFYRFTSSSA
jgi:hypothetical protein